MKIGTASALLASPPSQHPRVLGCRSRWLSLIVLVALALSPATLAPPIAQAAADAREIRAREAFAAGRYQDAIDLFAKLYSETLHPTYLRNIGRCYQNLGDPDKAITAFRDYLRQARDLTNDERGEINGYIQELEATKVDRSPAENVPTDDAPPQLAVKPETAGQDAALTSSPAPADARPVTHTWWFWTAVAAGVAVLTVGVLAASGGFSSTGPNCEPGRQCL